MKFITNKKQKEIDEMMIKKLRFVARETFACAKVNFTKEMMAEMEEVMNRAEQVFYADNVI